MLFAGARYLIRMDDISPFMDGARFHRCLDLCLTHGVQPLLGVIPDNRDPDLKRCAEDASFWDRIRSLYARRHVDVAMHGFQHRYDSDSGGLLGIGSQSEFAGMPYAVQRQRLQQGQALLEQRGLCGVDTFMAPSHSFDDVTLGALRDLGFHYVTDGFGLFPYRRRQLVFLPQQLWSPRRMPYGIWTICLHTDRMDDIAFARLADALGSKRQKFLSFDACKQRTADFTSPRHRVLNALFATTFPKLLAAKSALRRATTAKRAA